MQNFTFIPKAAIKCTWLMAMSTDQTVIKLTKGDISDLIVVSRHDFRVKKEGGSKDLRVQMVLLFKDFFFLV
jgi:hypothetical protein